jgi:hypothetical protein
MLRCSSGRKLAMNGRSGICGRKIHDVSRESLNTFMPDFTTAYDTKFIYKDISRNVLDFCALLRLQGFTIGPEETQDALRALNAVDVSDFKQFRAALQMVLCSSHEQEKLFDILSRQKKRYHPKHKP